MDQNALKQIVDRLKEANNVLVTVSANPSVDQLSACIGFTILLNHLGKHGTAVFSGDIPSTIEFLKPDDTLEKNTDSLRDFIIALDKSKADKLRYKVEDKVVKIFITPYRTSISDKDLDFSQGDFNVDVVMALGVHERAELDKAIMDHGRILHDATVISVNNKDQGNLGAINWVDLNASCLSEMLVELAHGLTADSLDGQMATAFMTGIVAETERFSNAKTSPRTMTLASELMTAGANQQLIASKLEAAQPIPEAKEPAAKAGAEPKEAAADKDGSLQIAHDEPDEAPELPSLKDESNDESEAENEPAEEEKVEDENNKEDNFPSINLPPVAPTTPEPPTGMPNRPSMALDPPSMGGQLTANSRPEHLQSDVSTDPLSLPSADTQPAQPPLLTRPANLNGMPIQPSNQPPVTDATPLTSIESAVDSPHLEDAPAGDTSKPPEPSENLDDARDAVNSAIASEPSPHALDPIEALGAQPVDLKLRDDAPEAPLPAAPRTTPEPPAPAPTAPAPTEVKPPEPSPFTPTPVPESTPDSNPLAPPAPAIPDANPFGAPPDMNGVNPNLPSNPNVPPSILPPSQPIDSTAANGDPSAPPPVPPPLMPPSGAI